MASSLQSPISSSVNGPLYAFSLPSSLLASLSLRSPLGGHASTSSAAASPSPLGDSSNGVSISSSSSTASAPGCSLCGVASFDSIAEQRAHFSADWHRYNVKRKLAGKPAVRESEWDSLVEGLNLSGDSLSGSDSSSSSSSSDGEGGNGLESSSDDEKDGSKVSRVLARQKITDSADQPEDDQPDFTSPRSPLLWFEAPQQARDTQFGVYRSIFPSATRKAATEVAWLDELRRLQVVEDSSRLGKKYTSQLNEGGPTEPASRTWTLLAVGGGHFAGAVISLVPRLSNKNGRIEKEVVVLASKTFHRYTTRRKQGGAQSANDNAKGNAKSVGAQLRRANEAALIDDIRQQLHAWRDLIGSSELVFLRASKTSHRIFYDYDDAPLQRRQWTFF